MRRLLRKFMLRQPNRGFLRMLGFSQALGASTETVTLGALRAAGIEAHWIIWLAREERVCAADAPVYVFHGRIIDHIARFSRKHPAMTLGLTTALWLARVLPERPAADHWMLFEARHRPIWLPPNVVVHRSRHATDDTFTTMLTGAPVRAHAPLTATLDCVRFRRELGHDVVVGAIRATLASGAVQLSALLARAKATKVYEPLLQFLAEIATSSAGQAAAGSRGLADRADAT